MAGRTYQEILAEFKRQQEGNVDVQPLYEQQQGLERKTSLLTSDVPKPTIDKPAPGLLSRIFDTISRPLYAVAEGTRRVFDPEGGTGLSDVGAFFGGAREGITGREKTTFSKVLGEHGHTGVTKALGGFALDVALDPTTYLSGGLVKGAGKATLQKEVGEKVLKEVGESAAVKSGVEAARTSAKAKYSKLAAEAGEDLTDQQVRSRIGRDAAREAAEKKVELTKQIESTVAPLSKEGSKYKSAFELRFLGKPFAKSEKVYDVSRKIGDKLLERSEFLSKVNSGLRTAAQYNPTVKRILQAVRGQAAHEFEGRLKELRALNKQLGLTVADREAITHAIEAGPEGIAALATKEQRQFAAEAKSIFDEMFKEEMDKGLHAAGDKIENYVHHIYKDEKAAERIGLFSKKVPGTETPGFAKKREFPTLKEAINYAKEQGTKVKAVEDIADILNHRLAKHYSVMSRARFIRGMELEFGVQVAKQHAKAIKRAGVLKEAKSKFIGQTLSETAKKKNELLFPDEIADVIGRVERISIKDPETKYFLKQFDRIQNQYKFLITAPNPGFHIRNLMGDVYNNFLDGVVNPRRYGQAAKYISEQQARTGVSRGISRAASIASLAPEKKLAITVGDKVLDSADLETLLAQNGLHTGFLRAEVGKALIPDTSLVTGGQKLTRGIRQASEYREDFARVAHFIDAIKKEAKDIQKRARGKKLTGKQLDEAASRAADRVRKFNFDYQDLTDFEKAKLRRVVPFYTWMRKNIPLQMEMVATRPGRAAVVPKGLHALEQLLGQPHDETDPFPGISNIMPQWLREMAPIRLDDEGVISTFLAPQLPISDLAKYGEGIAGFLTGETGIKEAISKTGQEFLSGVSPAITAAFELTQQKTIFGGRPIKSVSDYLLEKLPMGRLATSTDSLTRGNRLLNTLTGLGIYKVGPQARAGEIRRTADPWEAAYSTTRENIARPYGVEPENFFRQTTPTTASNVARRYSEFKKMRSSSAYSRLKEKYGL